MDLRATNPLLAVVSSVTKRLNYHKYKQLTYKATIVYEDNQWALILAELELGRHTVRSKFYALRLQWIIPKTKFKFSSLYHLNREPTSWRRHWRLESLRQIEKSRWDGNTREKERGREGESRDWLVAIRLITRAVEFEWNIKTSSHLEVKVKMKYKSCICIWLALLKYRSRCIICWEAYVHILVT